MIHRMTPAALLALAVVALMAPSALAGDCTAPMLPTDLDLITSVEASEWREVHLHGFYRLGMDDTYDPTRSALVHNLTLQYTEETAFRVSIDPHDAVAMTLHLHERHSGRRVAYSIHGGRGIERNLFAMLQPRVSYTLVFEYSLAWREADACPVIMMELAAQPEAKMAKFTNCVDGKSSPHLGRIIPTADDKYHYAYRSTEPFYMPLDSEGRRHDEDDDGATGVGTSNLFIPIAHYPIHVPHIPGRHQQWKLRIDLQARFLDGGDVAAFVTLGDSVKPVSPEDCASGDAKCIYGTRALRNHFIVQTTLWAGADGKDGRYVLWLVLRKPQRALRRDCAPYSMRVELFPMAEQETFATCAIDPLPPSFNGPGMYNRATGFMSFRRAVLVNLTTRTQDVVLQTSKPRSLLRVQLGDHKALDIDLLLLESRDDVEPLAGGGDEARAQQPPTPPQSPPAGSGSSSGGSSDNYNFDDDNYRYGRKFVPQGDASMAIVASSMGISGPEGIVYELSNRKRYVLRVSVPYPFREYAGQDQDFYDFCDSYELRTHVFPLSTTTATGSGSSGSSSCHGTKPSLDGMQEQLNGTKRFHFGLPSLKHLSFVHSIDVDKTVSQQVVLSKRFYIDSALGTSILVESDRFGGTVQPELRMDGTTEVLYGTHRSVGSSIAAVLQRGWYELRLLTPYVQMTSKKWRDISPDMPRCMRYNLVITMQEKNTCMAPLPLMEQFPVGVQNHHHYYDEFQIPPDGIHYMAIEPVEDSLLHIEVGESDAPVSIKLAEGTYAVAREAPAISIGHDPFKVDLPELMAVLKRDRTYTVIFNFNMQAAVAGKCRSIQMQMSLSPMASEDQQDAERQCDGLERLPQELDAVVGAVPSELDLAVAVKPSDAYDAKVIYFELLEPATFRYRFHYDFTRHGYDGVFCRCSAHKECGGGRMHTPSAESECSFAAGFRNSLEIPATSLRPGNYSLLVKPYSYGLGALADDDITLRCNAVQLHIVFTPLRSERRPPMCDATVQYLPRTFNGVGMLWPGYHEEMHFFQRLRVSQRHLKDETVFTITKPSILRAYVARNPIPVSLSVYSLDGTAANGGDHGGADDGEAAASPIRAMALSPNQALYVELPPGDYKFVAQFYLPVSYADPAKCDSVPFEISIIKRENLERLRRLPSGGRGCDEGPAFPTNPFHHGHDTLFRDPGVGFRRSIDFSVGERGARYDFDIRHAFGTGGLAVELTGLVINSAGAQQTVAVPLAQFPDRTFRAGLLQQGKYSLLLFDPVHESVYQRVPHASCVAYSVHLRFQDFGNFSGGPAAPTPSEQHPSDLPGSEDTLLCPQNRFDELPLSTPADAARYRLSGNAFRVPFENAISEVKQVYGRQVEYKTTTASLNLAAPLGSYVRVWARSLFSRTLMQTQLVAGGSTPVAEGQFFGWRTQSLVHRAEAADDSHLRLDITFFFTAPPKYHEDFEDCETKRRLETFELFVAIIPKDDVALLTRCKADAPAGKAERLPPTELYVDRERSVDGDFHFTQADHAAAEAADSGGGGGGGGSDADSQNYARRFAVQQGSGLGTVPTATHAITIRVPRGTRGAAIDAHLRYNIAVANMRLSLRANNQTAPLAQPDGGPLSAVSGEYSAESLLSAAPLGPGTYTLFVTEANAEPRSAGAIYCIPFHLRVRVTADRYEDAPPPPPDEAVKPRVASFWPGDSRELNAGEPLQIKFKLSQKARLQLSHKFAKLVPSNGGDAGGAPVLSSTEYFEDDNVLVAVWTSHALRWLHTYSLHIDGTAVRTAAHDAPFESALPNAATYAVASCGCIDGECTPGGACSCSANSNYCSRCMDGFVPSESPRQLGPPGNARPFTVCVEAPPTPRPQPPAPLPPPPPQQHQPQPPASPPPPPHQPPAGPDPDGDPYGDDYPPFGPAAPTPSSSSSGAGGGGGSTGDGSDSAAPTATTTTHGPFRTVRYVASCVALVTVAAYAATMLFQKRRVVKRTLRNPFRRADAAEVQMHAPRATGTTTAAAAAGGAATTTSAFDDDDGDFAENSAIIVSG